MRRAQLENSIRDILFESSKSSNTSSNASSCDSMVQLLRDNVEHREYLINSYGASNMLTHAITKGHLGLVRFLIDCGADIHERDDMALRMAAHHNQTEIARALLQAGANVHAMNDEAIRLASDYQNEGLFNLLESFGANTDASINSKRMKMRVGVKKYIRNCGRLDWSAREIASAYV